MERKRREKELGYLFVVGGPGGSGSSVISKMLADYFNLKRIYGGSLFRQGIKRLGFIDFDDFFISSNREELMKLDLCVDRELIEESKKKDILIESKVFAGISTIKNIPCSVKIWLDASLHVRTLRHLNKQIYSSLVKKFFAYWHERRNLKKRWKMDSNRYKELYGIDYDKPGVYNDIVIDSSHMKEEETFNLILKMLRDGGYIKKE